MYKKAIKALLAQAVYFKSSTFELPDLQLKAFDRIPQCECTHMCQYTVKGCVRCLVQGVVA